MTRTDDQLLFQTIDQIQSPSSSSTSKMKTQNYEERLRASLSKLILPDWYNHEYTSINGLRKTKSHGHVPRLKRVNEINATNTNTNTNNNNNNPLTHDQSPRLCHSSHRPSYRHRSPSRSWSERAPNRRDSTSSSYDSTGHVIQTRRSYAPGMQRVAQSSTWYKPRLFPITTPPKPLPRQQLKIDQEHLPSNDLRTSTKPKAELSRSNSNRSLTSEAESFQSAKNLPGTDSSSYASVNDRCLSPSTASYHTALSTKSSSSAAGYETPTPQFDDEHGTLSSHSSLSDLSHADTLEPTIEDLDSLPMTTNEFPSGSIHSSERTTMIAPTEEEQAIDSTQRPMENSQTHWYEGSLETCIPQSNNSNSELREISNDEDLREIDLNAVGDEFFLFSPLQGNVDDPTSNSSNSNESKDESLLNSPNRTSNRIFSLENQLDFHYSSSIDPFGEDGTMNNQTSEHSSMMITNLDDIFIGEDDEEDQEVHLQPKLSRRPIQEDILYEVEHENSLSEISPNTTSIVPIDETHPLQHSVQTDFLTKLDTVPISIDRTETPSLAVDTRDDDHEEHRFSMDLTSPSYYTSKIRHRHYSVGSYYDHKSTSVPLHTNHTLYLLGSAPVSPLSRASITPVHDSLHSYSPITYENMPRNLSNRVINPSMDVNEPASTSPKELTSKPTIRKSAVTFPQYAIPTPPPRTKLIEQPPVPPRTKATNADLQFIRAAIERVFEFSQHQPDPIYEEVKEEKSNQYPSVAAIQRFYKASHEPVTNLDDLPASQSSVSNQFYAARVKSSEHTRASSDEIDDTLNDIEDVDEQEEKSKRHQLIEDDGKTHQTSQETQTIEQSKTTMLNDRTAAVASSTSSSSTVPPIEIVTEMFIEQEDSQAQIEEINGDMVIFYDDIEIVEHSNDSYSSESDSASTSSTSSEHYSKPQESAPPIPARTLKPSHLINHSTINPTYELEKSSLRKKFDVNSVNDMLNRTETPLTSSNPHRLPSARHFVGKLHTDEGSASNAHQRVPTKTPSSTLPARSSSALGQRSVIADTTALLKQIQSSLSRNSLQDKQTHPNLSTSSKDLRTFVSTSYSPSTEQAMDQHDDSPFQRQARLSKSFHNVSEYPSPNRKTLPSKSVENHLDQVIRTNPITLKFPSAVAATSSVEENTRMMSMKWYTGHVNENSEIAYEKNQLHTDDLLHGYIVTHGNRETQTLLKQLEQSNDTRIQTALDDIRLRVAEFDASKTEEDLPGFLRYLERRLRGINTSQSAPASKNPSKQHMNDENPPFDTISNKSRASSTGTSSSNRQFGRQHLRSTANESQSARPIPPRRSSSNQENPNNFDEMLNTMLGLPKRSTGSSNASTMSRERSIPLVPTQMTTNSTSIHKAGRDVGKRLFESGTYKDPRLIYDGWRKVEKEEEPLETSV